MIIGSGPRPVRPRRGDDTGSLPVAVLLTMLAVSLSAMLLPMVVIQVQATRTETSRGLALHAARAGLEIGLGHIRGATDASGNGTLTALPCGPLTGFVTPGSPARYSVTVDYFAFDPKGRSDAWIAKNRLACPRTTTLPVFPAYALLISHGTNLATGSVTAADHRTLRATYQLQTTNQNIPGGLIPVYSAGGAGTRLCLDAGSASPATNAPLRVQYCSDPPSDRQKFAYNTNLNLVLVSSMTTANPLGMCLDSPTPHRRNNPVYFRPCSAPSTSPRQQWSFTAAANFEGTTDGQTLDDWCFTLERPNSPGVAVELDRCGSGYDNTRSFTPQATVGAGAAGMPGTGQLVNYEQFGRCLDVTNQTVTSTYLIVWPCKQAPVAANVDWNQKWEPMANTDGSVRLVTISSGVRYCLRSPGSSGAGAYPRVVSTSCTSSTPPDNLRWRPSGNTGTYSTSYRIADYRGYCLTPTNPDATPPDLFTVGERVSKVVVDTCSSAALQKWNAPANVMASLALEDLRED
jgi:hypothetical protein